MCFCLECQPLFSEVGQNLLFRCGFQFVDEELAPFVMMTNNGHVILKAHDAEQFRSNAPQLAFLRCFLFHKVESLGVDGLDDSRNAVDVFDHVESVTEDFALIFGQQDLELVAQRFVESVCGAIDCEDFFGDFFFVLNHVRSIPRHAQNATIFFEFLKNLFLVFEKFFLDTLAPL